jgi:hypothetical protein
MPDQGRPPDLRLLLHFIRCALGIAPGTGCELAEHIDETHSLERATGARWSDENRICYHVV